MSSDNSHLREVHQRARLFVDRVQTALRDERLQSLKDRRFATIAGAQWEGPLGEQFENKPRFEMNKIHLAVIRIINEYRNNRIDVDFTSEDGSENDQLADACDGLYRADEQDSGAQEAFDNCFEEGVTGGFGAIRLRTCYVDEEDEDDTRQRIEIVGITDADSCVFFDLDAKRQDKKDAMRAVVLTGMTPDAYRAEFNDSPASWPKEIHQSEFDWSTPDVVYVAEYYEIEMVNEKVHFYRGLALSDDEPNEIRVTETELQEEGKAEELAATGFKLSRTKNVKRKRCHKYIMSGSQVLDDCGIIAGRSIPLAPFYGKRWVVDGVERCMGHVRLAKDAQMLSNMLMSWLAEMAARFDMEKPILTPEQVLGHAQMWADDNIKKFPYLLINPMTDASGAKMNVGPVAYTKAPMLPPVMTGLMQLAETSLQDLLGNQQAGEQLNANVSAKAVELVQNKLDMQAFIYMSNFAKCVKRVGEIWLEMARDVYVEDGRKMKSVSKEGKTGSLELYRPSIDKKTGARITENDLGAAKFDVTVDVGPSSSSKRAATVRALTGMLSVSQDPETRTVLEAMAMVNMEGEGLSEAKDFFHRKLVRLGAAKPTDEEAEAMAQEQANQQPDANSVYLQAAAQKQQADALKAGKDAELTDAKIGQTQADTIATLAGVEQSREQHAVDLAMALQPQDQAPPAAPSPEQAPAPAP